MTVLLKRIMEYLIKGILYSIPLAVLGAGFSFLKGWPLLKGAYVFVLTGGVITMVISTMLLIGTPNMRKEYFRMSQEEKKNNPLRGGEGIAPALMGIVMIIIGFMIEALMH